MKKIKDIQKNDIVISVLFTEAKGFYMKAHKIGTPIFYKQNDEYKIKCMLVNYEDDMTNPDNFKYTDDLFAQGIKNLENTDILRYTNGIVFIHDSIYDTLYQIETFKKSLKEKLNQIYDDYNEKLKNYDNKLSIINYIINKQYCEFPENNLYKKGDHIVYVPMLSEFDNINNDNIFNFFTIIQSEQYNVNDKICYNCYAIKSNSDADDMDAYLKFTYTPHFSAMPDNDFNGIYKNGHIFNKINDAIAYVKDIYITELETHIKYIKKEIKSTGTYIDQIEKIEYKKTIEKVKKLFHE